MFGIKQLENLLDIKTEYTLNIKENIFKGLSGEIKVSEESINVEDTEIDLSEDSNDAENNEIANSQDSIQSSQRSQGHKNGSPPVELVGYISTCAHGCGRSSTDRQFYYVNSRPCEPTKIMKLINEIYRQFNPHQYPFVFLNIVLERTLVDVNVTPDKRKLFLAKEKAILDVVKSSISKLFENIPRFVKIESAHSINNTQIKPDVEQPRIFNSFMQQFSNKSIKRDAETNGSNENKPDLKRKSNTLLDYAISKSKRVEIYQNDDDGDTKLCDENDYNVTEVENVTNADLNTHIATTTVKRESANNTDEKSNDIQDKNEKGEVMYLEFSNELPNTQIRNISDVVIEKSKTIYCKNTNTPVKPVLAQTPKSKRQDVVTDKEELGKYNRKSITMKTSIDHVTKLAEIYNNQKQKNKPDKIKFKSEINPVYNKKCEEELSREISKDSFKNMTVIGQFNLGFIITRLGDDLFIIDQHATDEIYNFETLQKTTELTSQKLVM